MSEIIGQVYIILNCDMLTEKSLTNANDQHLENNGKKLKRA